MVQSVSDYEKAEEERLFMRAVGGRRIDGFGRPGHGVSLDEARVRLRTIGVVYR